MTRADNKLPRKLGDGLVLRWARPQDGEALAAFNIRIHSDDAADPEYFLGDWTRDLMSGQHPTTKAGDFTVVVDENENGKIVSSMNLISQTWAFNSLEFGVGRPELVGTDAQYRRRGLVRAQFEVIHAKSKARGEMVQGITGIPWYYRQFGYEMCVNLGGTRQLFWIRPGNEKEVAAERFQIRPATENDIPFLAHLYDIHCRGSLLARIRDEAQWRFECFTAHRDSPFARHIYLIETKSGERVGYTAYGHWRQVFIVREIAVLPGYSLREAALFIVRHLKKQAEEINQKQDKPVNCINFDCGTGHLIYEAIDWELEKAPRPYAWYLRVPDLPGFLLHISPELEKRLAASVMAGYAGETRLNFYRSHLILKWEGGKLAEVEQEKPNADVKCGASFPDLTFLQLLFGYRSLNELESAFADLYTQDGDTAVLLKAIFPKQGSWISALG